ncbi:MAG TPA: hypothetical protein VMT52_15395, partial [Planctomycetota bacterium]|nr:hypothetical protein [Planctomycetota bacterium]
STQRLLVFAQCYGGEFAASPFFNLPNTATAAATRTGEQAQYSGYHDDAARALRPEAGRTGETVHLEGIGGIFMGAAFNDFPEHPTSGGGLPLSAFSLEPVTGTGAVRSRHVIVYAGKPDSQPRRDPETGDTIPDGEGGRRRTRDVQDRNNIRINFAGEPNTTVTAVGGPSSPDDPALGMDGWDFSGTPEGLAAAVAQVGAEIAASPDASKEQFILFVGDHGNYRAGGLTQVPLNPNSRSGAASSFPSLDAAQTIGMEDPGFSFHVSLGDTPRPIVRDGEGRYVPFFGAGDFEIDITPGGSGTIVLTGYTEQYLELGDDILGNEPGEGLLFRFPVEPGLFRTQLTDKLLDIGITNRTAEALTVLEIAVDTGLVRRGPYDEAPEPATINTPVGAGPVDLRFDGLDIRIMNVSIPGLTVADRDPSPAGDLPPGAAAWMPHTGWQVESTASFESAMVSIRTVLPPNDSRAGRIAVVKSDGDEPWRILASTRVVDFQPALTLVTATAGVSGFSRFALVLLDESPTGMFRRGDSNADGRRDLSDAITVLGYLFLGTAPPPCLDAADFDDAGSIQLTDAIGILEWLFHGSSPPPAPTDACGEDPTADDLTCDSFPSC